MESDHVTIGNVNLASDNITHDGIDIVDGSDVLVRDVAVKSGDDAMCLKSGVRRGIDALTIRDSIFGGSGPNGGSNGIKFGTATYGGFKHIAIEDSYVKDVQYAAMAVESRQGSDIDGVAFDRIEFAHVGAAFFVYLAQQATTHPLGDTPKLGSITNVAFTDVRGSTSSWAASPHQGLADHGPGLQRDHVSDHEPRVHEREHRVRRWPHRRPGRAARGDAGSVPGIEHVRRPSSVGVLPAPCHWGDVRALHGDHARTRCAPDARRF